MRTPDSPRWHVVLPVKHSGIAKSRLDVPGRDRLARAFALDTIDAANACSAVRGLVVITNDPGVAEHARGLGALVVPDDAHPGTGPHARLNAAIVQGVSAAGLDDLPCAVLTADLPQVNARDLQCALDAASTFERSFVPDHHETGTVLLAAIRGRALHPRFGAGSASAHQTSGAVRLDLPLPRLRQDVDTAIDFQSALSLGVGPHTTVAAGGRSPAAQRDRPR